MKYIDILNSDLKVSQIALGCMRIAGKTPEQLEQLIKKAMDLGINFFDHADIYGGGKSEEVFGEVLKKHPDWREKMIIQTKCGICKGYYDFSKKHIIDSVNKSLERLQTDYVDVLLLHRPDALMDPQEVAEAFDELYENKKVKYFGVSNMTPYQIELIQKYTKHKLLFNQVQFNVVNAGMIDSGINANMTNPQSIDHDGGILDYCRIHDITIQPWSILQASWEKGTFLNHPDYQKLNDLLKTLGEKYGVNPSTLSLAWILRHPASMQPIAGTTSPEHLEELCQAVDIELSREDWYALYLSVDRPLP
ncbi:aldo/keto reductase [Beduini massiliensis]|uniref:aldo/keto reductase n=1 Tax=Beduini massiliensis TaxID=1585974 RepID=UPI00059A8563|nr:aldo/keto reductase [Beduini massiliensis]